jgi:tRNA A-37 threonylcarbamoyl transferase component Bud32
VNGVPHIPDVFEPVLVRLGIDVPTQFGCATVRFIPAGLQERPFSHVLRLALCRDGDPEPLSHIFVKVFKPKIIEGRPDSLRERVAHDYEITRQAYTAMSADPLVGAVRPLACYPDLLAIVTEQVTGAMLLDYLHANTAWFPNTRQVDAALETMATVGRWIRVFQANSPTGRALTPAEIQEYVDIRLERLVRHAPGRFTTADRSRVLHHLGELGSALTPKDLTQVTAHSDLSLGNLLVSGRRIVVLDFAMTRLDTRVYDVTKVHLQVDLLRVKPQHRTSIIRQLQAALLQGFDPSLTTESPLFRIGMLVHRVNHLTTLYTSRAPMMEGLYNSAVRRQHHQWLTQELAHNAVV